MAGENAALKAEAIAKASGINMDEFMNKAHPCLGVNRIVDADAGTIELLSPDGVTPRKKIALVGFASSTKDMAPFNNPEWAICGMNQIYRHIHHKDADGKPVLRHPDLHYEIHKEWNTAVVPGTDHEAWLRDCGIPVLMTDVVAGLPTSVRFPIERFIKKFDLDYFTSTVAYMLAFTVDYIDQSVERRLRESPTNGFATALDVLSLAKSLYAEYTIGVFGIDLIVDDEYVYQKPCAEYWLGQIMAREITLMIPKQSALLRQRYRYGYDMEPQDLIKDSDLTKRHAYLTGEHQKHSESVVQLVGAIKEIEYWTQVRKLREAGGTVG